MDRYENFPPPSEREPLIPEIIDVTDAQHYRTVADYSQHHQPVPQIRQRRWLAGFLFLATCYSTLIIGGPYYAIPIMCILLAHEMGHYLQARRYGVPASLPYFIPVPFPPLGTMGAVIVQGAGVADRRQLFDIAISGPLAGLVLALPITYFGLQEVQIVPKEVVASWGTSGFIFGEPLIFTWIIEHLHGPVSESEEVIVSPLAIAGWVGIFITALNLIPIGQLDGGHILFTMIGKRAHAVAIALLAGAVAYMFYTSYPAYGLMILLLIIMGPRHPPTADDKVPLGRGRIILGWLTLAFIIVGFTPRPIEINAPPTRSKPVQESKEPTLVDSRSHSEHIVASMIHL